MRSRRKSRASRRGVRQRLIPVGLAAVAAAVAAPALDTVGAGPRGVVDDFGLPGGGKLLEELAVVGKAREVVVLDVVEGIAEGHFAVLVVVAVGFAIGGNVDELGFGGWFIGVEVGEETAGKGFAVVEETLEGDGAGGRAVVEEDGDGAAVVELDEIGLCGINGGVRSFDPCGFGWGLCGRTIPVPRIRTRGTRFVGGSGGEFADAGAPGGARGR